MLLGNNVRVFALTKYRYMDGLGGRYTEVIDSQLSVLFDKSASTVFESAKGRMRVVKGVIDLENVPLQDLCDHAAAEKAQVIRAGGHVQYDKLCIYAMNKRDVLAMRYSRPQSQVRSIQLHFQVEADCEAVKHLLQSVGIHVAPAPAERPRTAQNPTRVEKSRSNFRRPASTHDYQGAGSRDVYRRPPSFSQTQVSQSSFPETLPYPPPNSQHANDAFVLKQRAPELHMRQAELRSRPYTADPLPVVSASSPTRPSPAFEHSSSYAVSDPCPVPTSSARCLPPLTKPTTQDVSRTDLGHSQVYDTSVTRGPADRPHSAQPRSAMSERENVNATLKALAARPLTDYERTPRVREPLANMSANIAHVPRQQHGGPVSALHDMSAMSADHESHARNERLKQYAAQNDHDRVAALDAFVVDNLENEDFIKLCEDVEGCWRRVALGA